MRSQIGRQDVTKAVRVRKARHRSTCVLCHGPIVTGQQIADHASGWAHVECFIDQRNGDRDMQDQASATPQVYYSYGEVGHDPPVHMIAGSWIGPKEVRRSLAQNKSLCGKKLARFRGRPSDPDLVCGSCRRLSDGGEMQPVLDQLNAQMTELGTVSDQDYEVQILSLGSLIVDLSEADDSGGRLQRAEQQAWSKKIGADFSWQRFNRRPPIVSDRGNGTYHVIDGQHSVSGARRAGYAEDTRVRCFVYRSLTRSQEAAMFRELNADRKSVKPIDLFRARIAEGEPVAVGISALLRSHGWTIGSHGRDGAFAAVKTLEAIYKQKDGPAVCGKTLSVITEAWDRHPDSAHQTVVKVVSLFLRAHPSADAARLAQILRREGSLQPVRLQMLPYQENKAWQEVAVVKLRERYNNRLDPSRRLES